MIKEIWKDIPGYEGRYQISDQGRVWSFLSHKALKGRPHRDGRLSVQLCKPGIPIKVGYISRMVAKAFIGPCPEGKEVCHNNGINFDNRSDNLRWDTHVENCADRKIHGVSSEGEKNGNATISDDTARAILASPLSITETAKRFGVSYFIVYHIVRRLHWRHIK